MTPKRFNAILHNRLNSSQDILEKKAKEYAQDNDRLFNFRLAAQINGTSMEKALWGMATKHLVSVMDLVEGRLVATNAIVDEKIGDMINYLILLEAVLKDRLPLKDAAVIAAEREIAIAAFNEDDYDEEKEIEE